MQFRKILVFLLFADFCFLIVSIVLMETFGGVFETVHKCAGGLLILLILCHMVVNRRVIKNIFTLS